MHKSKSTTYRESGYVVTGSAPVNDAGPGLTVTSVAEGEGTLADMQAFTGKDVEGVTLRGDNVHSVPAPEDEVAVEDV